MNSIINLNYRGSYIPVKFIDGEKFVSLTAMSKPFQSKRPIDWTKTEQGDGYIKVVQNYLDSQSEYIHNGDSDPKTAIMIIRGGKNPGTWAHELVALEYARYCSPEFSLWCNIEIKKLVENGTSTVDVKKASLTNHYNSMIMYIENDQKWGSQFRKMLIELMEPYGDKTALQRTIETIRFIFGQTKKYNYDKRKDIIHKIRNNFETHRKEWLQQTKNISSDAVMLHEVKEDIERMWAQYESRCLGQTKRHIK